MKRDESHRQGRGLSFPPGTSSAADDVPGGNERPRPCRCDSSLFMTATPYLLWVFGKNDVLLATPFIVLLSFTSLVSTTRCQTVSDAGRIFLLRVFSRNPRWCEASVPKLGEHQATPAECN